MDSNCKLDLELLDLDLPGLRRQIMGVVKRGWTKVWRQEFPYVFVYHLPRMKSDHYPLWLH